MGDSYASGGRGGQGEKQNTNVGSIIAGQGAGWKSPPSGLKPADKCGIPEPSGPRSPGGRLVVEANRRLEQAGADARERQRLAVGAVPGEGGLRLGAG